MPVSEFIKPILISVLITLVCLASSPSWASCNKNYKPTKSASPVYPRRAAYRGIEGYAVVKFNLTENGTMENIHVAESKPTRVFDRAAIQAAEQFEYKPCVVDDVAVAIPDATLRFNFRIDN